MTVVSDASPLIALSRAKLLHLLKELFGEIYVSPEVFEETVRKDKPGEKDIRNSSWIKKEPIKNRKLINKYLTGSLSVADATVICLAQEKAADLVLIDEPDLRKMAKREKLPFIGTVGILVLSKKEGLIESVKKSLIKLIKQGFRIKKSVYESILKEIGE